MTVFEELHMWILLTLSPIYQIMINTKCLWQASYAPGTRSFSCANSNFHN